MGKQVSLMNLMPKMTENVPDAAVQTITYNRKTQRRKRADLLAAFPAEEGHHELTEIGKQPVRQEVIFISAQLKKLEHIQHVYKCEYCGQRDLTDKIIKAKLPKTPLKHGLGSSHWLLILYIKSMKWRFLITAKKTIGAS